MEIKLNFKNFEPTEQVKQYVHDRFQKLEKYIKRSDSSVLQINLSVEKYRQNAEAILQADDLHLSAQEETEDMYATIDSVLDKLETQLRKERDKQKDKRKGKNYRTAGLEESFSTTLSSGGTANVVKVDNFEPKPIDVDEAVAQLESLDAHFLVFINLANDRVNVIYRRKNGDFGLIDPRM